MLIMTGLMLIIFIVAVIVSSVGILNERIKIRFYSLIKFTFSLSILCIFMGGVFLLYEYFTSIHFKNLHTLLAALALWLFSYKGIGYKKNIFNDDLYRNS